MGQGPPGQFEKQGNLQDLNDDELNNPSQLGYFKSPSQVNMKTVRCTSAPLSDLSQALDGLYLGADTGAELGLPQFNDIRYEKDDFSQKNLSSLQLTAGNPAADLHANRQVKNKISGLVNNRDSLGETYEPQATLFKHIDMIKTVWPAITDLASQEFPSFAALYSKVVALGVPNFLGAQIPVDSGLVADQWELALQAYHDKEICKFIRCGWPIGFLADSPPESVPHNHQSAVQHERHIKQFIKVELQHKAIVGPFSQPPFHPWTRCLPLMTRPKKNSDSRRVIVDLSFPRGRDVNSGINIKCFLGRDITFTLPSISDLTSKLQLDGPGAYMWKADLSRAYRQLRMDPVDAPLTGIKFKDQYYIDLCPPFGCRSSSAACQRVSNALAYIMGQAGHLVLAYLDDYGSSEPTEDKAKQSYHHFCTVANSLGLQLADEKCVPPTQCIEWLGYKIDSTKMTVAIPPSKLDQVLKECELWLTKKRVRKVMIQSLLGKLIYISNCVAQARKFVARIIATLTDMGHREWTTISEHFLKDVK